MSHHPVPRLFLNLLAAAALSLSAGLVLAKSVPGDGATPVVELMPLLMKHEADLQLSPEQIKALDDYRKEAAPKRMAIQRKILELRAELRLAILNNAPDADRQALMKAIAEQEIAHFQGRDRCVEFTRKTLTPEQFGQLKDRYLAGLR